MGAVMKDFTACHSCQELRSGLASRVHTNRLNWNSLLKPPGQLRITTPQRRPRSGVVTTATAAPAVPRTKQRGKEAARPTPSGRQSSPSPQVKDIVFELNAFGPCEVTYIKTIKGIPVEFLTNPIAGDNRNIGEPGTSRVSLRVVVRYNMEKNIAEIVDKDIQFTESERYLAKDVKHVSGKPDWFYVLKSKDAVPQEEGRLTRDQVEMEVQLRPEVITDSSSPEVSVRHVLYLGYRAALPLKGNLFEMLAPALGTHMDIEITASESPSYKLQPVCRVKGKHTEYPAFELFIDGELVYGYDPSLVGEEPIGMLFENRVIDVTHPSPA